MPWITQRLSKPVLFAGAPSPAVPAGGRTTLALDHTRRWVLALGAAMGVLVVGSVALSTVVEYRDRVREEQQDALALSRAVEPYLEDIITRTARYLEQQRAAIESAGGPDALPLDRIREMLENRPTDRAALRHAVVSRADGSVVFVAGLRNATLTSVSGRAFFQHHRDHPGRDPVVAAPFRSAIDGRWRLPVSVRLEKLDGRFAGVLNTAVELEYLGRYFASLTQRPGAVVSLVSFDGEMLARSKPPPSGVDVEKVKTILRTLRPPEGPIDVVSPVDGVSQIGAYRRVGALPIYAIVLQSREDALDPWYVNTAVRAGVGLVGLLVSGALLFLLLRHLAAEHRAVRALERREAEFRELNVSLEARVKERTQELKEANAEMESFASAVSHDLRAPLNHLIAYSGELAGAARERDLEGIQKYARKVAERTAYMGELIDALLSLSQVTRANLDRREVDLSGIAAEIDAEHRKLEPGRKVQTVIQPGIHVLGDPVLLRTLLENLLGNAWKYTSRKASARIEVSSQASGNGQVISVRDDGAGFDPCYASRLFAAFQRLHTQDEFPGTGVGLATARRIVSRHGGRIWAESSPGEGAAFHFLLGTG